MTRSLWYCAIAAAVFVAPMAVGGEVLHLIERATNEHVVDVGAKGDSLGDMLVFANPLYDAANTKSAGSSNGSCVRVEIGKSWHCSWMLAVAGGQIAVLGAYPDQGDAEFALAGGTGRYVGARGTLKIHARDAAHLSYDFTVSLL